MNGAEHIINPKGTHFWRLNGSLHREDGPAVMYPNGTQFWYKRGKFHREDGPAVIYPSGEQHWFINGNQCLDNTEYQEAANLSDQEMCVIILRYGNVK